MIKKVIITGSSGTIGTRLFERMINDNYHITGIDRQPNKWHERFNKCTIIADLCCTDSTKKLPKDIDLIIHLAANARVYDLVKKPKLAMENIQSTFNILEFARKNEIPRIIFASSREVYGNSKKIRHSEDQVKLPLTESPYSASKLSGEALIHAYNKSFDLDFIIFRFSNVYGMYDDSNRLVPYLINLCQKKKPLTVFGKQKLLDFTYIDDAVSGILFSLRQFEKVKNDTYNLAYGKGTSLINVAKLIQNEVTRFKTLNPKNLNKPSHKKTRNSRFKSSKNENKSTRIIIKSNRKGEVIKYVANIQKAQEKLKFKAKTNINEGIKKTIKWYML